MAIHSPFNPQRGGNQVLTANAASQSASLTINNKSVRCVNSGANICHVRIGFTPQVATTADTPILAGSSVVLHKQIDEDAIAYISAAGTTLHVQTGEGGFI